MSNFYPDHFIDIAGNMEITPAVNQVETHVFNQQIETQHIMEEYGKSVAQVALRWQQPVLRPPRCRNGPHVHGMEIAAMDITIGGVVSDLQCVCS